MIVQVLNLECTELKFGDYLMTGDLDLINHVFTDLAILKFNKEIDITPTFLAGKLLTNNIDEYHLASYVFPISLIENFSQTILIPEIFDVIIKTFFIKNFTFLYLLIFI